MKSSNPLKHWWRSPLAVQTLGSAMGGLLVVVIVGLASDLSFWELLLYVGLPVLAITCAAASALGVRAVIRTTRGWSVWRESTRLAVAGLAAQVRRLHLRDVVHSAQVQSWTVVDRDNALVFISPDEDELSIDDIAPAPETVADALENLSPTHFDAKSIPFIASVGGDAAVARRIAETLGGKTIPDLERQMTLSSARAALADVTAEAEANGWQVAWGDAWVRYERGSDQATVEFDRIDIGRLRKALGLKWLKV